MNPAQPKLYLVLKITSGPDAGRTVEITSGHVCYFGRAPTLERTTASGRMDLEPDATQIERAERYLAGRAPSREDAETTQPGFRPQLEKFKRLADVKLVDGTVSRVHALVFVDEDRAGVVDLASTNGTVVNGRKVSAAPIAAGDQLEMGHVKMEVVGLG